MKNSSRFFCNTDCEYYPCHTGIQNVNCLFCYCPLYSFDVCPGNYTVTEVNGKPVKDCANCTFPHEAGHYDSIMDILKNK